MISPKNISRLFLPSPRAASSSTYWLRTRLLWCAGTVSALGASSHLPAQNTYATPYAITTLAGGASTGKSDGTGAAASFNYASGVALDGAGNLYVADYFNNAVRKVTPTGTVTTLANLPPLPFLNSAPLGVAVDHAGNIYVSESVNNRILRITPAGAVSTLAGNPAPNPLLPPIPAIFGSIPDPSNAGYADGAGTVARFNSPSGLAIDSAGTVFVADTQNQAIRKITPDGNVTTFAGITNHFRPADVDQGWFGSINSLAIDAVGNLFTADASLNTIRKITPAGVVTTIAGQTDVQGNADGTGTAARFNNPTGVAVDRAGNVFVADSGNFLIREISPTGVVTTLAGRPFSTGRTDGTGNLAQFAGLDGLAVDDAGNIYAADGTSIRKGTAATDKTTQAITFAAPGDQVFGPAPIVLAASASSGMPVTFTVVSGPAILAGNSVTLTGLGTVTVRASQSGNGNILAAPDVDRSFNVAADPAGPALTSQPGNQTVAPNHNVSFEVTAPTGTSFQWQVSTDGGTTWTKLSNDSTYSGTSTNTLTVSGTAAALDTDRYRAIVSNGAGVSLSSAAVLAVVAPTFPSPVDVALDASGHLLVTDNSKNTLQTVSATGVATLLAGSPGQQGAADGTGSLASFRLPGGTAIDANGNLYLADTGNSLVRKITAAGVVTTFAGSASNQGFRDGTGVNAWFNAPAAVALDAAGNLYVADTGNSVIREITPSGVVTTLAGTAGVRGSADGAGSAAQFNQPSALAVDASGNVFVADTRNHTIRRISPAGSVTTLAGLPGVVGSADGAGSNALFNSPLGLTIDAVGTLWVADSGNSTIRRITPAGLVSTIAGLPGISGLKDGTGNDAWFSQPTGLRIDPAGILYVADTGNAAIRRITAAGTVTTWIISQGVAAPPPPVTTPATPTPPPPDSGHKGGGSIESAFVLALGLIFLLRLFRSQTSSRLFALPFPAQLFYQSCSHSERIFSREGAKAAKSIRG